MSDRYDSTEVGEAEQTEQERELLLLALLDRYASDCAVGLHRDLADYYAATPEIADDFLAAVLAAGPAALISPDTLHDSAMPAETLAPGVRRTLATLPDMPDMNAANNSTEQRLVAEARGAYQATAPSSTTDSAPENTKTPTDSSVTTDRPDDESSSTS